MNRYFVRHQEFRCAVREEAGDPERSLRLYGDLRRANRQCYWDLLALATILPAAAAYLAHLASVYFTTPVVVTVLVLVGFVPVIVLYGWREEPSAFRGAGPAWRRQEPRPFVFILMFLAYILLGHFFLLGLVAVLAIIIAAPCLLLLGWMLGRPATDLPPSVVFLALVLATTYSLGFWFSRSRPPLLPLKEHLKGVLTDLRLSGGTILQLLCAAAMGALLVGTGPLGLLHEHLWEGVLAGGVTGLLLGLTLYRPETDVYFGRLVRFGEVRCQLRLNRRHEARYRLYEAVEAGRGPCPQEFRELAGVLAAMENPRTHAAEIRDGAKTLTRLLNDAEDHGVWARECPESVHLKIWQLTVRATCALAHPEILSGREELLDEDPIRI